MRNRVLTAALLAALSAPAFAQDAEEEESGPLSYNIGIVSDYAFRGVSQTNEGPAIQGGIDYAHDSGFYVGTWASNVDYVDGDNANIEWDLYVGWSGSFSDSVSFDVSLLRYTYFDQSSYNYNELLFGLGVGDYLSFQLAYSNDVYASDEDGIYYQVAGTYPLPWWELTLNGSAGHYDLDDAFGDSYSDFSLGLTKPFGPMTVGLQWVHATDDEELGYGDNGGTRVLLTTIWEW
ncbi:MAG: hypothetical protein IT479_13015 [Xanthomonadales bacterium]|nr:hypothetical protein [Xanthomonadales bacterium]MCC6594176.1 hypothetical protein [Xanthomonadales bacterium]MCE7931668.1 hypothetical protein [Xanthomonadales bacterium PRO6]